MTKGFFEEAQQERDSCTPPVGFNVCEYDPMGRSGDNLTVCKWFEDRVSAEAWADIQRAKGVTMYVFGKPSSDNENIISKAESFAKKKHKGQFRKRFAPPNVEYFDHLEKVVCELGEMGVDDNDILCTGWLHDTIEDTDTDYDEIMKKFNEKIADYVASVTKDTRLVKVQQERQYVIQLEDAPWQSKIVKLADIIANFKDLPKGYSDKSIQDAKVKAKIPYIMAIKSELVTRPETPNIESALKTLNELLEKHNQDKIPF